MDLKMIDNRASALSIIFCFLKKKRLVIFFARIFLYEFLDFIYREWTIYLFEYCVFCLKSIRVNGTSIG